MFTQNANKHPQIGLQPFGTVVHDGYRPAKPRRSSRLPGYDENVTILMNMGLADRARAEQVLEVMQNNVERAVDFLLAAAERR